MEFGEGSITIRILVSGSKAKLMDMEFITGRMETDMKVNGICV